MNCHTNLNRDGFVEENPHAAISCSIRCWLRRSTSAACSRVTDGKLSRKYSSDNPSARYSNRVRTGTRVPLNTGVPSRISGFDTMSEEAVTTYIDIISQLQSDKRRIAERPAFARGDSKGVREQAGAAGRRIVGPGSVVLQQ